MVFIICVDILCVGFHLFYLYLSYYINILLPGFKNLSRNIEIKIIKAAIFIQLLTRINANFFVYS